MHRVRGAGEELTYLLAYLLAQVKKMDDVDPSVLTEQERTDGITKLRYLQMRDALSSSVRVYT